MIPDQNRIYDGFDNLAGGQDAGRSPDLIGENQCAGAENVIFRGGKPRTRPGFRDLKHKHLSSLRYSPSGARTTVANASNPTSKTAFETGVFQSVHYYSAQGQPECLVAMIGGRMFRIDPKPQGQMDITEVALPKRNAKDKPIAYMVQADRFLIAQDGESRAIIYDGVTARRSGVNEVITGTIMAYGMGRLVVVRGQDIYFGDLYGSHEGKPGDAVLKFTETTFLNEGGPAAITPSMGAIKGLTFAPQQDSSTGDGELLAFAERGVTSFFLSTPREQWKESAFQRVTLINVGARGHRAMVSINGDVWFRANDGVRSYRQARAEMQGWAHLPMSTEVRPYLDADTPAFLDYASAIRFDNRLHMTCTPRPNNGRVYNNGSVALDFDVLSSFGNAAKPAWDGHWTKLKLTQLVEGMFHGEHRAFAFAIDKNGKNHIYELTKRQRRDFDAGIECELVGRSMTFMNERGTPMPFNEKELYGGDVWIDDVTDKVSMTLDYRPDQHPEWTEWATLPQIAPVGFCQRITCGGVPTVRKNFSPRKRIKKPSDECDTHFTKRNKRRGFEFQVRLKWTGHASIKRFRAHAKNLTENAKGDCE